MLSEIRTNRQVEWRMAGTSYNDIDCIKQEVLESRRLFLQHGWPILDITGRAVEETAARVIHLLGLSGPWAVDDIPVYPCTTTPSPRATANQPDPHGHECCSPYARNHMPLVPRPSRRPPAPSQPPTSPAPHSVNTAASSIWPFQRLLVSSITCTGAVRPAGPNTIPTGPSPACPPATPAPWNPLPPPPAAVAPPAPSTARSPAARPQIPLRDNREPHPYITSTHRGMPSP